LELSRADRRLLASMKLIAEFLSSVSTVGAYPRWRRIEVAFAGRSNVGKSSLLNALVERRGLARTSKTPGRTRALNFFGLGDRLALVDLPGYGYARMSRAEAAQLGLLIKDYLSHREHLRALVLLVDARRGPEAEELEMLRLESERSASTAEPLSAIVVATKSDKVRPGQRPAALKRFAAHGIDPVLCSTLNGEGIVTLRRQIMAFAAA
jgi:GTP-binding protein